MGKMCQETEAAYFKVTSKIPTDSLTKITEPVMTVNKAAEIGTGYLPYTCRGLALHQLVDILGYGRNASVILGG
jgi:hypothetical protein